MAEEELQAQLEQLKQFQQNLMMQQYQPDPGEEPYTNEVQPDNVQNLYEQYGIMSTAAENPVAQDAIVNYQHPAASEYPGEIIEENEQFMYSPMEKKQLFVPQEPEEQPEQMAGSFGAMEEVQEQMPYQEEQTLNQDTQEVENTVQDEEMANLMNQIQLMQNQGEAMAQQQYSFSNEEAMNTQRLEIQKEPEILIQKSLKVSVSQPNLPPVAPVSRAVKAQNNIINNKFNSVFGNMFKGHNQLLQKKLNAIRLKFMQDQKKGIKHCGQDFQQIHQYRHLVNQRVFQAIKDGVFQKVKDLDEIGNLMEDEEANFNLSPPSKPRSASGARNSGIGVYYKDDPKSKSYKLNHTDHFLAQDQLRAYKEINLKKLKKDNRDRLQRIAIKQIEAQKLLEEEQIAKIMVNHLKIEQMEISKNERREKAQERVLKMQAAKIEKEQKWKIENKFYKEMEKPLFKRIEENFDQKKMQSEIKLKEKCQLERKTKYKPILNEELEQFSSKVDKIVQYLTNKRQEKRADQNKIQLDLNSLQTNTYVNVKNQEKEKNEMNKMELEEKKQMLNRRVNYAKYVKQVHLPPKSDKKAYELQHLISGLKHPVKVSSKANPGGKLDEYYVRPRSYQRNPKAYEDDLKLPNINQQTGSENEDKEKIDLKRLYKSSSYKNLRKDYIVQIRGPGINEEGENPALSHLQKIKDRRHPRPAPDYLDQMRELRIQRESTMGVQTKIRGIISKKNMTTLEKLQHVQLQTQKVEQKAFDREKIPTKINEYQADGMPKNVIQQEFEKVDEVNSMLLDAIKAKLAILDHQTDDVEQGNNI